MTPQRTSPASTRSSRRGGPASLLKLSADVATFYGFRPVKSGALNTLTDTSLAFYASAAPAHAPAGGGRELGEFGLAVLGSQESFGEVILLKALTTIIAEWGGEVARVRVNALGDKDSKLRFARELSIYLRKHAPELDSTCRDMLSADPLSAFACQVSVSRDVIDSGPRAMNFLSEKSRAHFRAVLEHLESIGLPYELDDMLVGDEREPRVVFAVDLANEDATIVAADGGRFDDHLRRVTGRKEASVASASLYFRKKGLERQNFTLSGSKKTPKIFFVQLGPRARLSGLTVLDQLRRARVPVLQSFGEVQLGPQMAAARAAGVTHLIILGAREVLDHTVLVRSVVDSSQEIVPLKDLPRYVKNL